jgi:hypothetical protein
MRSLRPICALALLLLLPTSVLAQTSPPAPPSPAPPPAEPDATVEAIVSVDPNAARRQALFDAGFVALVEGNLATAERAFGEAAALPGDPAMTAVADSFVERVQRLRERRRMEEDAQLRTSTAARTSRDQGRTERIALLGASTALGLGLYGWTLPQVLGVDPNSSTRGFVGLYMLTSASAFIVPYLLVRHEPISPGQANLAFYGGTRGIWYGVLLGSVLAGELGPTRRTRGWHASMLLGSMAGMMGGYYFGRSAQLTAGEARTMAAVGDLGLAMGFGAGFILRLHGNQPPCGFEFSDPACFQRDKTPDEQSRGMAAAGLVGAGLGLGGGYYLARRRDNTWGDGEVLRGSSLLGVWLAIGVADLTRMDFDFDNRALMGMMMGGGTLGLAVGDRLVRNTNFTPGQSMLIDLSMISGGLLGAGTAYLVSKDDDGPYLMASAVGAMVGFGLSYWGFHDSPESRTTRRLSGLPGRGVTLLPTVGAHGQRGLSLAGMF